ncbi:hypothetical protein GGI15_004929 [Coemansia interrupta]|uniref:Carbohydrate kinase PfkB domain-containing protein n=1 Tax=Coemansia interrupta TaxID=1126814 RepID=A0A9W8H6K4_9FUNG|nr:hypothetical protein GGI15_004929 [Coemansia interrupta]
MLFSSLTPGSVNRALKQTSSLGQNFAFATKQLYGWGTRVTLLQILGGSTGRQIEALETSEGLEFITISTSQATRTCTTCLDAATGQMTELVGLSDPIDPAAATQYVQTAIQALQSAMPPKALAICGSLPSGLDPAHIAQIVSSRIPEKTLLFVDSAKHILPTLQTGHVNVFKVNSDEILDIAQTIDRDFDTAAADKVVRAAKAVGKLLEIDVVAVTDGPATAYLVERRQDKQWAFSVPDLLADREYYLDGSSIDGNGEFGKLVLNPLGAGDTCSAVMLNSILDGMSATDAFALGLSAASASCLVPMPNCVFDRAVMKRIRERVLVTEI